MIFTVQDIQNLFGIIEYRIARVVADVLGKEFLSPDDERILKENGFDWTKELKRIPTYWQSFLFGRLSSFLTPQQLLKLDYTDLNKYIERKQYKQPNKREMAEYRAAAVNTYSYIKGMGNKIKDTLSGAISQEELKTSIKEREEEVRQGIKEEIERGVLEKRSVQNIVSNLGHRLDEWNRDWGRIVETEMQNVYLLGKAQTIMEDYGPEARVYKHVFEGACFPTKDTEFLTNEGFKFLDDIRGDELAATYNLKTNTLEYSPIISKIKYLYKGDMHSYNHKSLDLICTPNHKMLVSLDYKKNKVIRTRNYLIDSSDVLNKKLYYMRYSVENWDGFDCDKIEVADHSFSTKCFARFMGWYLSEGHCVFRGKDDKGRFHASNVCVSQQKKENLQEIFDCMCDLFGKNVTYQYQSVFVVSLDKSWDSFVLWLKSLGTKAWLKVIPQEIKMLSKRFLLEFIDAYLKGDNYYTYLGKETLGKKHTGIITSSSKLRDDFMEIVLKCGLRPSTQTLDNIGRVTYDKRNVRFETHRLTYVVRILTSTKFTSISNHRKILKDWEGEVGCIEVEKNNTIFIRRNGTCIWTGNCKHCIKFYTTQGIGSQPRIFKLNELIDNGSNIGRKQVDWTPTLPGTHPFCRCELHYIPEGYVWDEETKQFQPPKEHKRRVERKSKVKIQVGDKTFEV